jgi:hypothetical protein
MADRFCKHGNSSNLADEDRRCSMAAVNIFLGMVGEAEQTRLRTFVFIGYRQPTLHRKYPFAHKG